ncbi:oxidoreductase [Rhizobium rhizosphaerae]|uniref:Oxidoreductase n=1 Tax=Xaviernesmea rhizosphaerae TaxID=1672749 RepID=A0A1Q9AIP2_9HYPH|nr:FAD-binding oxidoreductase [Xaviernesmea rhizosphaerae]OLP55121.1 oxidoreductase [Xaviernesmea rhizosphaerae]OQP84383.1 oxidoreductase [Xaviernesmea rhizosphaerae]
MAWQSPISPGISLYEETAGPRPAYPPLSGSRSADVAIIGGGFTGLNAALHLASQGVATVLIDGCRFGDGASGRNGGQLGTGQRNEVDELEKLLGYERSKALFDMAEHAKKALLDFARDQALDIDYRPGHLSVTHKAAYERDYRHFVETLANRYDYPHVRYLDREATEAKLGSRHYVLGVEDSGTGHIQPMKLVIGLARAAAAAGAALHEQTRATRLQRKGTKLEVETSHGTIRADRVLIACNAHIEALEPVTANHVMPIRSFIGATEPLARFPEILPEGHSVADSRFVVRYFRKSPDGRLLFGGREAYTADSPADLAGPIRGQIAEVYPQLKNVAITHAWGGSVGITLPRRPFVREVMPGVTSIGGYSGHGVMLANYCGRLYAQSVLGGSHELDLLKDLPVPPFPGGRHFRSVLLFVALSWYALRDRL